MNEKIFEYSVVVILETSIKNYLINKHLMDVGLTKNNESPIELELQGFRETLTIDDVVLTIENKKLIFSSDKANMFDKVNKSIEKILIKSTDLKVIAIGINFNLYVNITPFKENFSFLNISNTEFNSFEYTYEENNLINRLKYYLDGDEIKHSFNNHYVLNKKLSENEFKLIYDKSIDRFNEFHSSNDDLFYIKEDTNE